MPRALFEVGRLLGGVLLMPVIGVTLIIILMMLFAAFALPRWV